MAQHDADHQGTVYKRRITGEGQPEEASEQGQQERLEDRLFLKENPLVFTGKGVWILVGFLAATKILTGLLAGGIVLKVSSFLRTNG